MFLETFFTEARAWAKGKSWPWRLLLLIWFVYVFIRHAADPMYDSIIGPLNLGIHEFGHLIFMPLGEFMHMIGGTIFQMIVPFFAMFNFYRQDDFFSIALSFGWLSTNFFSIARYAADTRRMEIPISTPFGGNPIHDWNYLLVKWRLLHWDMRIAGFFRILAAISMLICFLLGVWLIWLIFQTKLKNSQNEEEKSFNQ
mgnify:CR=1 FL=1|tara:strand:- start:681 stop:1274 length:594 start_codon:yes stop_codon:yes gene_type:complete